MAVLTLNIPCTSDMVEKTKIIWVFVVAYKSKGGYRWFETIYHFQSISTATYAEQGRTFKKVGVVVVSNKYHFTGLILV